MPPPAIRIGNPFAVAIDQFLAIARHFSLTGDTPGASILSNVMRRFMRRQGSLLAGAHATIAEGRATMTIQFNVNGKAVSTEAPPQTPLLWVIREGLKLTGTKFGCGTGLCGACMVHIDGKRAYSCQTHVSEVA